MASRSALLCVLIMGLVTPGMAAQQQGRAARASSPYLSLGHWAYDYVNLLVARGRLGDLMPLVQPYRRVDVAQALIRAERQGNLLAEERRWIAELRREFSFELGLVEQGIEQELRFGGEFRAGLKGITQKHRDPLRPEGDGVAFLTLDLLLTGDVPTVAGAFHMRWDGHYLNDPQFPPDGSVIEYRACDPLVDDCAYRMEEAYVEVQLPYVRIFLGRLERNWGAPGTEGFLVSDYSYSYDHVGYRFGSDRLALTGLFSPLSDFGGDTTRYFSSHRFDWRVRDNLVLSAGESVIYGGPGQRLDLNFVNPVNVWEIGAGSKIVERNSMGLAEVWWRPWSWVVGYWGFLLDNTKFGDPGEVSGLTQWGSHLGLMFPSVTPVLALRTDFSIVNSLAYRNRVNRLQYYTVEELGLGRDKSDAIIASLQADWFRGATLVLQPRLDVMWRGGDDIRLPWPDDAFTGHPLLLVGEIEATVRPALKGRWRIPRGELEWDVGVNFIRNEGNVPSGWRSRLVGRSELVFRMRL